MYIRRVEGRRTVTLPNGRVMTRADLPPPETCRWVARRKAAVVRGLLYGLLTRAEALRLYRLSEEELDEWLRAFAAQGEVALRATRRKAGL